MTSLLRPLGAALLGATLLGAGCGAGGPVAAANQASTVRPDALPSVGGCDEAPLSDAGRVAVHAVVGVSDLYLLTVGDRALCIDSSEGVDTWFGRSKPVVEKAASNPMPGDPGSSNPAASNPMPGDPGTSNPAASNPMPGTGPDSTTNDNVPGRTRHLEVVAKTL
jgi:hypothetical protein